jgi:long-chain acyl-CoA synthetase
MKEVFLLMDLDLRKSRPWIRHYDRVVPAEINYPTFPAYMMLKDAANVEPDKAATYFFGTEITFWDLYLTTIRLANKLIELGVKKGDRIGILLPNSPQFVIAYWSLLTTGAIVVNLNPMYTRYELSEIIKKTGLTGLFSFDMALPNVKAVCQEVDIPLVIITKLTDYINGSLPSTSESLDLEPGWHHFSQLLEESTNTVPPRIPIKEDDPALIQFTGGTTGIPKGATLSNRNLVAGSYATDIWGSSVLHRLPPARRFVLCTLPYFHVYGEIVAMSYAICSCSTQVILPIFDIEEVMRTIENIKEFSFWPCVPTMLMAVVNHPKAKEIDLGKKFALVNNGAAPCPLELIERAKDLNIFLSEGWGMSETTSLGISNPIQNTKKPLSIGIPFPDIDIRIVDLQTGEDVKPGERGEIMIKGPLVMGGYWNDPEETAKQMKDGWLYTGDVAYQDEDGYVFIVDRSKDMIIAGGYNIYPRDIDEVIFKHPKVKDVITIGIPDAYRGETIKSFVQLVEGATVTEQEIIDYCRQYLAAYKVPRSVEFRDQLPRTNVGKALRRLLRDEETAKQ